MKINLYLYSANLAYYFNKQANHSLTCFSFDGTSTPLTRDIFDEVILNHPMNMDKINSTSASNYMTNHKRIDKEVEEQQKAARQRVYKKYIDLLQYYIETKEVTLGYFIRKNIDPEDREIFKELTDWYCRREVKSSTASVEVQKQTASMIVNEALAELSTINLDERVSLVDKYNAYLDEDNLREHCTKSSLVFAIGRVVRSRLEKIEDKVIEAVKSAYKNGNKLTEVATQFHILTKDFDSILKRKGVSADIMKAISKERREQKVDQLSPIRSEKRMDRRERWQIIISELLASDKKIDEFCRDYNGKHDISISPQAIFRVLKDESCFDSEYSKACLDKIITEKVINGQLNNLPSIMFGITNGVESRDRVRSYTLFDLYVDAGEAIELSVVKELLLSDDSLTEDERRLTKVFLGKAIRRFGGSFPRSMGGTSQNSERIRNCTITINCEDGPHTVTDEEKEKAINFVDSMHFPSEMYIDAVYSLVRDQRDLDGILVKKMSDNKN